MTRTIPITRVTLFVPGPRTLQACPAVLRAQRHEAHQPPTKVTTEWVDNDGEFGDAFSFGTVSPEVRQAIDDAAGALVLHWPVDLRDGRNEIVDYVEALSYNGAIAVRLEQSRLGWDVSRWLKLFSRDSPLDWHQGAVLFLTGEGAIQSCGMHAFSLPDVRVALDGEDAAALQALASALNLYQIDEDPVLLSGQTFSPDAETPRRLVERWPDTSFPPDDACHNPYGVLRLGPPGGKGRALPQLAPVFTPALSVLLTAAEEKRGGPLTRAQVEAIRDKAACMMMERRDAQQLERSRGYADLEPELVWEQWQLMRENAASSDE